VGLFGLGVQGHSDDDAPIDIDRSDSHLLTSDAGIVLGLPALDAGTQRISELSARESYMYELNIRRFSEIPFRDWQVIE